MWQITINGPGYYDTTYDLPEGATFIGRADNNDIVLSGDQVSRRHARFQVTGETIAIEDLGSRNGTTVNGKSITGVSDLSQNDILTIGENSLVAYEISSVTAGSSFARKKAVTLETPTDSLTQEIVVDIQPDNESDSRQPSKVGDNHESSTQEHYQRIFLERHYNPSVVQRLASAGNIKPLLQSHQATVMFISFSGLTSMVDEEPLERVTDLLSEIHEKISNAISSFDGAVERLLGSAILAAFGIPYQRPDDAVRAVRCALRCRVELNKIIGERSLADRCTFRIALSSGKVVSGLVGAKTRLEHVCLGDTVNIAARIYQSANSGEVVVTNETQKQLSDRFRITGRGDCRLGSQKKIPIYAVLDEPGLSNEN